MTGLRCSDSEAMRSLRRARRASSWASCRSRHPGSTRRRSLREGITRGGPGAYAALLGVAPAAAPDKVQHQEAAEKEGRYDDHEPNDTEQKVDSVQNSSGLSISGSRKVGTAGFEPATTRPPAECATRLRHVPTQHASRRAYHTKETPCYHAGSTWRARHPTSGPTPRAYSLRERSSAPPSSATLRARATSWSQPTRTSRHPAPSSTTA